MGRFARQLWRTVTGMTGSGAMDETTRSWTVSGLGEMVAQTDQFAGGGAVAAMSLVGATATAELVFQLSERRRSLDESDRRHLQEKVERARRLRARFLRAIDDDLHSLSELMDAQRRVRRARKSPQDHDMNLVTGQLRTAVDRAIHTPLQAAKDAATLLYDIEEALPLARTFTVSDLGAAAATAQGAIVSLLLMAEVNLGMLDDLTDAERLGEEVSELHRSATDRAGAIVERTRQLISARDNRDGT